MGTSRSTTQTGVLDGRAGRLVRLGRPVHCTAAYETSTVISQVPHLSHSVVIPVEICLIHQFLCVRPGFLFRG